MLLDSATAMPRKTQARTPWIADILGMCSVFDHDLTVLSSQNLPPSSPRHRRFLQRSASRFFKNGGITKEFGHRLCARGWSARCTRLRVPSRAAAARGFSILELLVAATTLAVALTALAHLMVVASLTTRRARTMTAAAVLAQAKIEALGPQVMTGAAASPPDSLVRNVDGFCDFVDAAGYVVGAGTTSPASAAYLRRWSVAPLPESTRLIVLQVLVTDPHRRDDPSAVPASLPGDARIVSLVRIGF